MPPGKSRGIQNNGTSMWEVDVAARGVLPPPPPPSLRDQQMTVSRSGMRCINFAVDILNRIALKTRAWTADPRTTLWNPPPPPPGPARCVGLVLLP